MGVRMDVRVLMDGGFGGMEENKKSASPKKNYACIKAISREP